MFVIKNFRPESKKELQLKSHALSRRSPSPPYATSANTSTPITTNNATFKHAPLNLRYLPTKRVLTDKVTNNPFPKHINTDHYQHEQYSARERYVHAIYSQNTLQCPTKEIIHVKPITTPRDDVKSQRDLTSNDIVCRDMYSNCDVNAYRFRRAKSMYINRSYCYRDDNNNNNTTINNNDSDINSRKRKILNMTSDIFFTESSDNPINKDKSLLQHHQHKKIINLKLQHNNNMNTNNGGSCSNNNNNNNNHSLLTTTNVTKHTLNNMHSIHNRNPMNFYTKTNAPVIKKQIIHSKYSPQCNWQLMNIEAAVKRSKTVEPRLKTLYRRKSFCTKTNDRDHELFNYYNNNNNNDDNTSKDNSNVNGSATPRPHCKHLLASMKGMNSVKYNIISPGRLNSDRSYRYKPAEDTAFSNIDYYEIECGDKFNKMNTGLLKNTFYSEGIHIFKFEEKTNLLNGKTQGKFTFKVRKGENQKEFNDKMEKIENKLKMKDLKLVKKGGGAPCYKPT